MNNSIEQRRASLSSGKHVCLLPDGAGRQIDVASDYLRQGVARREHCLCFADKSMINALADRLAPSVPDAERDDSQGAIEFLADRENFLLNGRFSAAALVDFLRESERIAREKGLAGTRFLGDVAWALGPGAKADDLIKCEASLDEFLQSSRSTMLCLYDRPDLDLARVHDAFLPHPSVYFEGMASANPHVEPTSFLLRHSPLAPSDQSRRELAKWRMDQLHATRSATLDQERIQQKLQESEDLLRLVLDSTAEAIYGVDLEGNLTLANRACMRLLGYTDESELLGRDMHELVHYRRADGTQHPKSQCPVHSDALRGQKAHASADIYWRKDGTFFNVEFWAHPLWRNGTVIGAVVNFLDISDRVALEERLRQAQKMEAIGHLAGGIAHDFNNILTIVNGYSELLLQSLPPHDPAVELVATIKEAGERSAYLTRQLLAFSRKQVLSPKVIDLNSVVRDAQRMLVRLISEDIQLTMSLERAPGRVRVDPGQIEQLLINLGVNARDAMPKGGQLTIETKNVELDDSYANLHDGVPPGRYVCLSLSDTGEGIAPDVKGHIFEPFFTTKEIGRGTGLGLAVVYGIVKQSDGHIEVYSEEGIGTTFKIYLPRVDTPASMLRPAATTDAAPRGSETILLAEDDEAVRALCARALERCGYQVLKAANGADALQIGAAIEAPIHLLITDVVMPELGGRDLAERLRLVHPEMKVIYASGYTDDAIVRHGILEDTVHFLQKPLSPSALARRVREVLDTSPK